jgi:hypothetical protein
MTHLTCTDLALSGYKLPRSKEIVARKSLTIVEISFCDHEFYAEKELIAAITHDEDLTQPWVVIVNNIEVHRADTWARCQRYIQWHHQNGTLPEQQEAGVQGAERMGEGENLSPLHPTPCPLSSSTTGNEIMSQIARECEKFELDLMDDGIYHNDIGLGEVGCTNSQWWFVARGENQQQIQCDSALDAVWWLSMVDVLTIESKKSDYEELLDRPFDELIPDEWKELKEYEPIFDSRELMMV